MFAVIVDLQNIEHVSCRYLCDYLLTKLRLLSSSKSLVNTIKWSEGKFGMPLCCCFTFFINTACVCVYIYMYVCICIYVCMFNWGVIELRTTAISLLKFKLYSLKNNWTNEGEKVLELLLVVTFSKLCFSLLIPDSCTVSAIYFTTVSCSSVHPSLYCLMLHNFSSVKLEHN